eukprot:gene12348-12482_t
MVGALTLGRVLLAQERTVPLLFQQTAVKACKIGLTIAIRYAAQRPHGVKSVASWTREEGLQSCRECCGLQGFLFANKIGVLKTDMDLDVTGEGDNTVMMQPLPGPSHHHHPDLTPAAAEPTRGSSIRSTQTAGEQAVSATAVATTHPQAFDDNLDRAMELAWVHVDRLCLGSMILEISGDRTAEMLPGLAAMAVLFGVTKIERYSAGLMQAGLLDRSASAAVRAAVNGACRQLATGGRNAPMLRLVEAFGTPDDLLAAPISFDWTSIVADHLGTSS